MRFIGNGELCFIKLQIAFLGMEEVPALFRGAGGIFENGPGGFYGGLKSGVKSFAAAFENFSVRSDNYGR